MVRITLQDVLEQPQRRDRVLFLQQRDTVLGPGHQVARIAMGRCLEFPVEWVRQPSPLERQDGPGQGAVAIEFWIVLHAMLFKKRDKILNIPLAVPRVRHSWHGLSRDAMVRRRDVRDRGGAKRRHVAGDAAVVLVLEQTLWPWQ